MCINLCEDLLITDDKYSSLPDFPNTISSLMIRNMSELKFLPKIPNTVKHLSISNCPYIITMPKLPRGLKVLEVSKCRYFRTFRNIPPVLSIMRLIECYELTTINILPFLLIELTVVECGISELPVIPHGLNKLRLTKTLLMTAPSLPDTINELITDVDVDNIVCPTAENFSLKFYKSKYICWKRESDVFDN